MTARLTTSEVAILLDRLRRVAPDEAERLSQHIELIGSEDALLTYLKQMVEATTLSKAAEETTAGILAAMQPVMAAAASALEKIAIEDKRRNDLEEKRADREHADAVQIRNLRYNKVIVPIASAIAGAIAAASTFYFVH